MKLEETKKTILVNCSVCNKEIERKALRINLLATCFDCKMNRIRERSKKQHYEKRRNKGIL